MSKVNSWKPLFIPIEIVNNLTCRIVRIINKIVIAVVIVWIITAIAIKIS